MPDVSNDEQQEEKYSGPGAPTRLHDGMDVGEVLKYPFQDSEWLKKVLVMGLIGLIPIVGGINLLGWMKECFQRKKEDNDTLPEAGFQHLQPGVPFFLALLLPMGISFVANVIASIIRIKVIGALLSMAAGLIGLAVFVVTPAVMYIYLRDDDVKAVLKVDKLQQVILGSGVAPYIMLLFAFVIGGFVAWLGSIAACLGVVFTMPIGAAMVAAALAEFTREMKEVEKNG